MNTYYASNILADTQAALFNPHNNPARTILRALLPTDLIRTLKRQKPYSQ